MPRIVGVENAYSTLGLWCKRWVNRRSQLGQRPSLAEPPPVAPGKPWWTEPPKAKPDTSWINYAVQYREALIQEAAEISSRPKAERGTRHAQVHALIKQVNTWLVAARHHLHDTEMHERLRLTDPEDLWLAVDGLVHDIYLAHRKLGGTLTDEQMAVWRTLQRHAAAIRRARRQRRADAR